MTDELNLNELNGQQEEQQTMKRQVGVLEHIRVEEQESRKTPINDSDKQK